MLSIDFIINPYLNLFFHLERLSGSVPQRFSKKYYQRFLKHTNKNIINEFKWNFDSQVVSWNFKKELVRTNLDRQISSAFDKSALEFSNKIKKLFSKNLEGYIPYWKNSAKPRLEKFRSKLKELEPQIKDIVLKTFKVTKIPWKSSKITIYLIESLSEEYGIGAEPINNGIAIGIINNSNLLKKVIVHELIHLNVKDRIIRLIPYDHRKNENEINEALTNIIMNIALGINKKPVSQGKMKFYINLFWKYFKKTKIEDLDKCILQVFNTL